MEKNQKYRAKYIASMLSPGAIRRFAQMHPTATSRARRSSTDLPLYLSKTRTTSSLMPLSLHSIPRYAYLIVPPILLLTLFFTFHSPCPFDRNSSPLLDRFTSSAAHNHRPPLYSDLKTLILVAGHAIYTGSEWTPSSLADESNWILEPFQHGQVSTFLSHIRRGVQLAANDSNSLLLFSGGQTREGAGPRSEAMTYWLAADAADWYGNNQVKSRTLAEEHARDSFENLLFSVCRFSQLAGHYPTSIKVVSFEFKRTRFVDVHRKALRFPRKQFEFYGVDPPGTSQQVSDGEKERAFGPFANDPYGCNTQVLSEKRQTRNPYLRYHPYPQGCPELAPLFRHCGRKIFDGPLPWDPTVLENQ